MKLIFPDFIPILFASMIIALIIIIISKKMKPKTKNITSTQTYTCGENITKEQMAISENTYYKTFIDTFNLKKIKKLHSGDLTEYLHALFVSLVIIMTILVLTWY